MLRQPATRITSQCCASYAPCSTAFKTAAKWSGITRPAFFTDASIDTSSAHDLPVASCGSAGRTGYILLLTFDIHRKASAGLAIFGEGLRRRDFVMLARIWIGPGFGLTGFLILQSIRYLFPITIIQILTGLPAQISPTKRTEHRTNGTAAKPMPNGCSCCTTGKGARFLLGRAASKCQQHQNRYYGQHEFVHDMPLLA